MQRSTDAKYINMKKVAFTIVLNGMPFLPAQFEVIPKHFDTWYIIEGAANPVNDTGWCAPIPKEFHNNGLSVDGTTEFLDKITSTNSNIKVIRSTDGFWPGKTAMCNSFMSDVTDSVLMQIDVDEFWNPATLANLLSYCVSNKSKLYRQGMQFKCNFFVGPHLKLLGNNCYGDMPYEWNRLWVIKEPTTFLAHEPPILVSCKSLKNKTFTFEKGWFFDHYAYVKEEQLRFKEAYYGYPGATENWKRLQQVKEFPVKLKEYFKWVHEDVEVVNAN